MQLLLDVIVSELVCHHNACACSDIHKLKDARRDFEKISANMDSALVRNAQMARSKVQDCDDANNYLTAVTSGFYHTALDYVFQVSCLPSNKHFYWFMYLVYLNQHF